MNDNVYIIKVISQEKIRSYCEKPSLNCVLSLNFAQYTGIKKGNNLNSDALARENLVNIIIYKLSYIFPTVYL